MILWNKASVISLTQIQARSYRGGAAKQTYLNIPAPLIYTPGGMASNGDLMPEIPEPIPKTADIPIIIPNSHTRIYN